MSKPNKVKLVKQWWLLFHDTSPDLNLISAIARTNLLNHVQQHVVSIDDYNKLESDAEAREAQLVDLVQELMLTLKIIEDHDNDPDKGIGFQNELATRMILAARAKLTELNISTEEDENARD